MRWDLIRAIEYRLEHPEQVPEKSWFTVFRSDIQTLLQLIEENENEQRERQRTEKTFPRNSQ